MAAQYVRIESISAPVSAQAGSVVQVSVTVKNLYAGTIKPTVDKRGVE